MHYENHNVTSSLTCIVVLMLTLFLSREFGSVKSMLTARCKKLGVTSLAVILSFSGGLT